MNAEILEVLEAVSKEIDVGDLPGGGEEAVRRLSEHLYQRHFTRWSPADPRAPLGIGGSPGFVTALGEATHGATYWEGGWRVTGLSQRWAAVSNGLLSVFVTDRRELRAAQEPSYLAMGESLQLRLPCFRPNLAPHFVYLVSPRGRIRREQAFFKFYLNLRPEVAAELVETLFTDATASELVFEVKVPNRPEAFCRVDAAVVYADPGSYLGMRKLLQRVRRRSRPSWGKATPVFTHRLRAGLAVAESPSEAGAREHRSYGQQRCGLIALAIVTATQKGLSRPEQWAGELEALLRAEGIDPRRPYLQSLSLPLP